ncbi:MAG: hypothetical protein N2110_08605, partial [Flavobacteriales bacterium]|nr:hypothetical protein [Flavobacteriales bacterium]
RVVHSELERRQRHAERPPAPWASQVRAPNQKNTYSHRPPCGGRWRFMGECHYLPGGSHPDKHHL